MYVRTGYLLLDVIIGYISFICFTSDLGTSNKKESYVYKINLDLEFFKWLFIFDIIRQFLSVSAAVTDN